MGVTGENKTSSTDVTGCCQVCAPPFIPPSSPVSGGGASQHSADLVLDLGDQDLGQHNARDLRVGRWHGRKHANQWFVLRIKHLF